MDKERPPRDRHRWDSHGWHAEVSAQLQTISFDGPGIANTRPWTIQHKRNEEKGRLYSWGEKTF